ncbi:MAG TPA: DnaJ domain-containing protein [Acidobacteriota bacterium]|nr:DnaJ domain-containing protein [Acidobacteriota bacterium]
MRNLRNYYRLLHVQPDAPVEVIRASFRTLMRDMKQHPDLGGSSYAASLLNEAYKTLCDPALRAAYDRELSERFERKSRTANPRVVHAQVAQLCPFCRTPLTRRDECRLTCPNCSNSLQPEVGSMPVDSSRRSVARIKRADVLYYFAQGPKKAQEAMMIDLSPKGMRFYCYQRLSTGTVLKINGPDLNASAIVTNQRLEVVDGRIMHSVGVSFLEVEFDSPRGSFLSVSV